MPFDACASAPAALLGGTLQCVVFVACLYLCAHATAHPLVARPTFTTLLPKRGAHGCLGCCRPQAPAIEKRTVGRRIVTTRK